MGTSWEGVKREAWIDWDGGGACAAVLASGGLGLRWVVSSSGSSSFGVKGAGIGLKILRWLSHFDWE